MIRCSIRNVRVGHRWISTAPEGSNVRWFYATDIPIRKPFEPTYSIGDREPNKFIAFSRNDSARLERMFQIMKAHDDKKNHSFRAVPVNEDYLFEVDLKRREVKPAYWEGPVYEVRRGIWFNTDHLPVRNELAFELEKHRQELLADKNNPTECQGGNERKYRDVFSLSSKHKEGKMVLYADEKTAFILPDLYGGKLQLNWLRSNLAQAVQFGAYKVVRGADSDCSLGEVVKGSVNSEVEDTTKSLGKVTDFINWQILGSLSGLNPFSSLKTDESNKVLEKEVEADYARENESKKEWRSNYRDVDHLVFCIHGIGQNLGKKYQYVNFAHTVNVLRSNLKKMYSQSAQLKTICKKEGFDDWEENCRTQVIPITWRNKVGFNTDDAEVNSEEPELPTLSDITVDGVRPLRKVLGDVVLDLLLYGEAHYKHKILQEVTGQLNHVYHLYRSRHPNFDGKVHIMGHSLGSLLIFDILANQDRYPLDFDVENFFSIGSPVGVFKLIQKTKIGDGKSKTLNFERPQCKNLFNIFHVCDPVAYRIEPLVDKSFSAIQSAYVPHWTSSDIASKVLEIGGSFMNNEPTKESSTLTLTNRQLNLLTKLNHAGRVDYAFLPSFLEVDLISAIKAHVSYFEEMDLAAFMLKQVLSKGDAAKSRLLAQKRSVVETD